MTYPTLLSILTDVKSRIADSTGKFYQDTTLNSWIMSGAKDIARRAEVLEDIINVTAVAGTNQYSLPTATSGGILRIHRVEFQISTSQIYLLEPREYNEMDSIWGINQLQQQAYPSYFAVWGIMVGSAQMRVYPTPSQAGTFNLFVYRLPATASQDTDPVEVPGGWEDLISLYCEYVALRSDSDPRWKDAKSIYEDELATMVNFTRSHHDQQQYITYPPQNVPAWGWMGGNGYDGL